MMPEHLITRISITIQALFSSISTYIQCKLHSEEVIDEIWRSYWRKDYSYDFNVDYICIEKIRRLFLALVFPILLFSNGSYNLCS